MNDTDDLAKIADILTETIEQTSRQLLALMMRNDDVLTALRARLAERTDHDRGQTS